MNFWLMCVCVRFVCSYILCDKINEHKFHVFCCVFFIYSSHGWYFLVVLRIFGFLWQFSCFHFGCHHTLLNLMCMDFDIICLFLTSLELPILYENAWKFNRKYRYRIICMQNNEIAHERTLLETSYRHQSNFYWPEMCFFFRRIDRLRSPP